SRLFVREAGRWLVTPLFLVVIVLETTDLVLAVDSVAAVFGVTRDPFIVYSSNVCAILGLRALYFLLAGILPYFQYLDEGLAIAVMFIGAKMLADPWVHISTGQSLAIVGGIIALSLLISVIRAEYQAKAAQLPQKEALVKVVPRLTPEHIAHLADADPSKRAQVALDFLLAGTGRVRESLQDWEMDDEFRALLVREKVAGPIPRKLSPPKLT